MEFKNTKVSPELVPEGTTQLYQGHVIKSDAVGTDAAAGTFLSKKLDSIDSPVSCTRVENDTEFPSRLHVDFGAHDAQVGDKRYVHFAYKTGKTMVLPVTVSE